MALLASGSACLLLSASHGIVNAQTDAPWIWTGSFTLTETRPVNDPGPISSTIGEQVYQLHATLRLSEGHRVPVMTVQGGRERKTGEFVQLVDAGSAYTATYSGATKHRNRGGGTDTTYSGGRAIKLHIDHAWIYRSLSPDDPAKAELPDGAYVIGLVGEIGDLRAKASWWTEHNRGTREYLDKDIAISTMTSGPRLWREDSPDWPLTHIYSSVAAASVRSVREQFTPPGFRDHVPWVMKDGVMEGSFAGREILMGVPYPQTASWRLERKRDVRPTLNAIPRSWRPKRNEPLPVTAGLDPALNLTGRFRFKLSEVSRHPGFATNAGGADTGLDLAFAAGQEGFSAPTETSDGWVIESLEAAASATVNIEPRDYGAWGRLTAEVEIDGAWYECITPDGRDMLTLPIDDDENGIADGFESRLGIAGEAANTDRDAQPEGHTRGDGFSNFEEYRGFMVMGAWEHTYPGIKDLFIKDDVGLTGENIFGSTGINVHYIQSDEYEPASRIVNFFKSRYAARHQHGLHMVHGDETEPGVLGRVMPVVGPPRDVMFVTVDIFAHYRLPDTIEDATLDDTVAHELGHAVDIHHHGHWEVNTCAPNTMTALWGGAHAGDTSCVMRYDGANYYKGWDGQCHAYTWDLMPGSAFCSAKDGTGINAGPQTRLPDGRPMPVSGTAVVGDCLSQITLVPWW